MPRERPHTSVDIDSKSDNDMRGLLGGQFQLAYPMRHMLEIESWVALFHPEPLYSEVENAITEKNAVAKEGAERACETCGEVQACGFEYEEFFTDDEYLRILAGSGACSLECAIKYAFRGKFAPSVAEFNFCRLSPRPQGASGASE